MCEILFARTSRRRVNAGCEGSTSTADLSYPVFLLDCAQAQGQP